MKKIDLMIVGAQKAGTTSLKNYLAEHPQIRSHFQTEFTYFGIASEYTMGYASAFDKYISKNDIPDGNALIAKHATLYTNEAGIKRLYDHNPNAIVVFIVRDPVQRAYSSYNMELNFNSEWMEHDFHELIEIINKKDYENPMYRLFIRMGLYSDFLSNIYKYFPKEQVKIYFFEEMKKNPVPICQELFRMLKVSDTFVPNVEVIHNKTSVAKNKSFSKLLDALRKEENPVKKIVKTLLPHKTFTKIAYKLMEMNKSKKKTISPLDKETVLKLAEFYRPYNKKLDELAGIDSSFWDKDRK